jgi:hypothetical protein
LVEHLPIAPEGEVADGNNEAKITLPVAAQTSHKLCIAARELIRAVDVAGNVQEIGQAIRDLPEHLACDLFGAELYPRRITLRSRDVEQDGVIVDGGWALDIATEDTYFIHARHA